MLAALKLWGESLYLSRTQPKPLAQFSRASADVLGDFSILIPCYSPAPLCSRTVSLCLTDAQLLMLWAFRMPLSDGNAVAPSRRAQLLFLFEHSWALLKPLWVLRSLFLGVRWVPASILLWLPCVPLGQVSYILTFWLDSRSFSWQCVSCRQGRGRIFLYQHCWTQVWTK